MTLAKRSLCRVVRVAAWVGIPGTFALISLCAYWELRPYHPPGPPPEVVSPRVVAGEPLEFAVSSCEGFSIAESVTRTLDDASVYSLAYREHADDQAGCHRLYVDVPVPREAMIGVHRLTVKVEWKPNPIRTRTHIWAPVTFEVVASPARKP